MATTLARLSDSTPLALDNTTNHYSDCGLAPPFPPPASAWPTAPSHSYFIMVVNLLSLALGEIKYELRNSAVLAVLNTNRMM